MGELINGRTPEEIKRNLSYLVRCEICPQNHEYGCDYEKRTKECQTTDDALALIEHLEAKQPKWISVKERLPEDDLEVMVYTDRYGGRQELAYYVRRVEAWYQNCSLLIPNVTHWMPKPEPPEEG